MNPEKVKKLKAMLLEAYDQREQLNSQIAVMEEMLMYAGEKISDEEFEDIFKANGNKSIHNNEE